MAQFQLKMVGFNGFVQPLAEGSYNEMQARARKFRGRHDGPVTVLVPGKEWELEDPGTRMISDWDGYLKIVRMMEDYE
jgi:hypothetical protein